jgi:hypothetical protein
VLEYLVGVDHVEARVGEVQGVHVGDREVDGFHATSGRLGAGQLQRLLGDLGGGHPARGDVPGEVGGDGAGSRTDVQQRHPGHQMRQQVAGGVGGGTPAVRAQHALVVAVRVDVHTQH